MINEASVYAVKKMSPEAQQSLGLRVLIMRRWPRGIARQTVNVWLPDAGPSVELLSAYNDGLVLWDEFETRYRQEQESLTYCRTYCRMVTYAGKRIVSDAWVPLSPMQVLRDLEQQYGTVTVMCRERVGEHCHRHIVISSFQEQGMLK
jgi:uncharacterized protein YeaO (DUF488 family)